MVQARDSSSLMVVYSNISSWFYCDSTTLFECDALSVFADGDSSILQTDVKKKDI